MAGLIFGATCWVASEATVARQKHHQPEGRHESTKGREPRALASVEGHPVKQGLDVQEAPQARRCVLHDIRQLVSDVRRAELLEVDQPARAAVPHHVFNVAVPTRQHCISYPIKCGVVGGKPMPSQIEGPFRPAQDLGTRGGRDFLRPTPGRRTASPTAQTPAPPPRAPRGTRTGAAGQQPVRGPARA